MHGTRLKFYRDASLSEKEILPHVLSSETEIIVARLLRLQRDGNKSFVAVRWKGFGSAGDTLDPILQVYEDVPELFFKLLSRKSTPRTLAASA